MIFIIIGILLLILLSVGIVILVKSRKDEIDGYYTAAQNILKEDKLDSLLKNPYKPNSDHPATSVKTMVYLKLKGDNSSKYVFNLDKEIHIGRDKALNQVCVNEAVVSSCHCRMFSDGLNVFIQDLNSVNGLEVKRGFTRYYLAGGNTMQILANDVLKIGTTCIKVVVFYFDCALM